ncbi:MAG: threonine/serine dehydratase [Pseudomonadota bacterium]
MDSTHHTTATLPNFDGVVDAGNRVAGFAIETPLLEYPVLNERCGGRVLLKAENLQRTGSFKFRGAWNCLSAQAEQARENGVVAWSSGNHAQGVALAARMLGAKAAIVMPADAPATKIGRTRALGAELVLYDRYRDDREALGRRLAAERNAVLVPSYDDPLVIAGQGTMGLEIVKQCQARRVIPDTALICCGGGGLTSGASLAMHEHFSRLHVHTVEPSGFDDTARSLASGQRVGNEAGSRSICDALLSPTPGSLTWPILKHHVVSGLVVTDDDALSAMRFAFTELKLVLEPGGAVALAAVLSGRYDVSGKTVVVVLSGGNVDPALVTESVA